MIAEQTVERRSHRQKPAVTYQPTPEEIAGQRAVEEARQRVEQAEVNLKAVRAQGVSLRAELSDPERRPTDTEALLRLHGALGEQPIRELAAELTLHEARVEAVKVEQVANRDRGQRAELTERIKAKEAELATIGQELTALRAEDARRQHAASTLAGRLKKAEGDLLATQQRLTGEVDAQLAPPVRALNAAALRGGDGGERVSDDGKPVIVTKAMYEEGRRYGDW